MPAEVHLFKCLKDNYGVLLHDPANGATASIDAPEAGAVEEALRTKNWRLSDILVTHHHADHTAGHISYWFKSEKLAFVGDTLFSVGCGRLLEGTADVMWPSLLKLRGLPPETEVYCGHEYTAANVHFALTIEPKNAALRARADEVVKLCDAGRPTIPSTIGSELQANPFLRADLPEVAAAVGLAGAPPVQVFAAVRARKDKF